MAALLKDLSRDSAAFGSAVLDVARLHSHAASGGVGGVDRYLVLLADPPGPHRGDMVLLLSRQIQSAAERQGVVNRDGRTAARRANDHALAVMHPAPRVETWVRWQNQSLRVSLFLPPEPFDSLQLEDRAERLGIALARSHVRSGPGPSALLGSLEANRARLKSDAERMAHAALDEWWNFHRDLRVVADLQDHAAALAHAQGSQPGR